MDKENLQIRVVGYWGSGQRPLVGVSLGTITCSGGRVRDRHKDSSNNNSNNNMNNNNNHNNNIGISYHRNKRLVRPFGHVMFHVYVCVVCVSVFVWMMKDNH